MSGWDWFAVCHKRCQAPKYQKCGRERTSQHFPPTHCCSKSKGVPAETGHIDENVPDTERVTGLGLQGKNGGGKIGYMGLGAAIRDASLLLSPVCAQLHARPRSAFHPQRSHCCDERSRSCPGRADGHLRAQETRGVAIGLRWNRNRILNRKDCRGSKVRRPIGFLCVLGVLCG
jgi:hypothetical protein